MHFFEQKQFDSLNIGGHRTQFTQSLITSHVNEKKVKVINVNQVQLFP